VLQSRDGFHEHSRHASFIDADEAPLPILQLEPSLPLEPVSIERPKRRVQFQNQLPWPFSSPPGVSNQEILNRDIHFKMPVPGPAGHPGITKTSEPTTFHHENRNKTSANQLIPSAWIHNWQKMQYEFKDTVPLLALMAASRSTKFPLVMGVIRTMNRQATEILIEICNMEGVSVPCIVHKSLTNEYGHILIPGVGLLLQDISLIIYSDQRYSIEPRFLVIIPRNIRKIYYLEGDQTEENDVSLTQYRSVSLSAVSP
jgi:hypothetical protein